jgi:trans-2,3-dihydro-3-hydroxyanthranilate isomerase
MPAGGSGLMAGMRLSYDIVDVFTDRPFAGNQLAVVHGARELTTEQCLALAQEFNYAETTFPAPVNGSEYVTRIFTPAGEIPFAGHPTLGTAWVLRSRGELADTGVTQVCGAGRIGVRFEEDLVELSATPRDLVGPVDEADAASLLESVGLAFDDVAGSVWVAGTGLSFAHVPVRQEALARAVPSSRPMREYPSIPTQDPLEGLNVVVISGEAPALTVDARVFVPGLSIPEDAATGSAAAGLGMALVTSGRLPEGGTYEITQGVEMGRPSRLHGRVEVTGGRATMCHVAGQVHPVASGEIAVPGR